MPELPENLDVQTSVEEKWGLQLPCGRVLFDDFHGRPVATPEDRAAIVGALQIGILNLGYSVPDNLLKDYRWVKRTTQVVTITHVVGSEQISLTDPSALPDAEEGGEDKVQTSP